MIDNNLKPWLLEINASPSLTVTTELDRNLKMQLLQDTFAIVAPPNWAEETGKHGANTNKEKTVGYYTVLIDESQIDDKNKKSQNKKIVPNSLWK